MAQKKLITHVKFTNKAGVTLPNVNWIAGVDYDDYKDIDDGDEEYTPPEHDNDINMQADEEINQEEIDKLLADDDGDNNDGNQRNQNNQVDQNNDNNDKENEEQVEEIDNQNIISEEESNYNSNQEINEVINKIQHDFEENILPEGEAIINNARPQRERRPVDRLTYNQIIRENDIKEEPHISQT